MRVPAATSNTATSEDGKMRSREMETSEPTERSLKTVGTHPLERESFDIVYFLGNSLERGRLFLFVVSLSETFAADTRYF